MTTLIPYIPWNGTFIVIVHPNVKIVEKKNHVWANDYLQKCTNVGLKVPKLMCTIMDNMYARNPKETWNNETIITLKASRFGDLTLPF